jgi:UPF0755 protein
MDADRPMTEVPTPTRPLWRRPWFIAVAAAALLGAGAVGVAATLAYTPVGPAEGGPWCLHVTDGEFTALTPDEPACRASAQDVAGFRAAHRLFAALDRTPEDGRYCFDGPVGALEFVRRVSRGDREEVAVVVRSVRLPQDLAGELACRIRTDSAAVAAVLAVDSMVWRIRPDTYRMWWESDAAALRDRLYAESVAWWTPERTAAAAAQGLTPQQAVVLASIVQEETAETAEAAAVAGLYLNRLRKGMLLQADPTVKFAVGDFSLRRVLDRHVAVDNPYNTYKYPGLPPGPIRIPETVYVEAVLAAESHAFLFMCARPDDSGRHDFAVSYDEHLRNAAAYQRWLNQLRIFR